MPDHVRKLFAGRAEDESLILRAAVVSTDQALQHYLDVELSNENVEGPSKDAHTSDETALVVSTNWSPCEDADEHEAASDYLKSSLSKLLRRLEHAQMLAGRTARRCMLAFVIIALIGVALNEATKTSRETLERRENEESRAWATLQVAISDSRSLPHDSYVVNKESATDHTKSQIDGQPLRDASTKHQDSLLYFREPIDRSRSENARSDEQNISLEAQEMLSRARISTLRYAKAQLYHQGLDKFRTLWFVFISASGLHNTFFVAKWALTFFCHYKTKDVSRRSSRLSHADSGALKGILWQVLDVMWAIS